MIQFCRYSGHKLNSTWTTKARILHQPVADRKRDLPSQLSNAEQNRSWKLLAKMRFSANNDLHLGIPQGFHTKDGVDSLQPGFWLKATSITQRFRGWRDAAKALICSCYLPDTFFLPEQRGETSECPRRGLNQTDVAFGSGWLLLSTASWLYLEASLYRRLPSSSRTRGWNLYRLSSGCWCICVKWDDLKSWVLVRKYRWILKKKKWQMCKCVAKECMSDTLLNKAGKEHPVMAVWLMLALSLYWQSESGVPACVW